MIRKRKLTDKENALIIANKTNNDDDNFESDSTPTRKVIKPSKAATSSCKTISKKANLAVSSDEEDDEDEEDEEEEIVEESTTKKAFLKNPPKDITILSVYINPNKITVNGVEVLTFSPSKAVSNVTRQSNLDGDIWKELCTIKEFPPGYDVIYDRLVNIANESDWELGKVFRMHVKTGATIDKSTDDAVRSNKKKSKTRTEAKS